MDLGMRITKLLNHALAVRASVSIDEEQKDATPTAGTSSTRKLQSNRLRRKRCTSKRLCLCVSLGVWGT